MFDTLSAEIILSLASVGVSGLVLCGSLFALKATQRKKATVEIDRFVKAAPFHRLHNVVQVEGR